MTTEPEDDIEAGEGAPSVPAPRTPERDALDQRILRRHRGGATYRQILDSIRGEGFDVSLNWIERSIRRSVQAERVPDAATIRGTTIAQIDEAYMMLRSIANERVRGGENAGELVNRDRSIRAIERMVTLWDRKAKLLGLDAPSRRVVEIEVVTDSALRSEREMLGQFLADAGIDVSALPTPQQRASELLALASAEEPIEAEAEVSG